MKGAVMLFVLIVVAVVAGIMLHTFIGSFVAEMAETTKG
jgi:hypothetical protein